MGFVNALGHFLYGAPGSSHDASVFKELSYKKLESGSFNIPESNDNISYHFLSNDAFGLSEHIMKPYPERGLGVKERIFNYQYDFLLA